MASTEPSRLYRARPWLAAKRLEKDPAARLRGQIRHRSVNLVLPVATFPLLLAQGQPWWLVGPGIAAGMVHSILVLRTLKRRPEIFLQKDANTRALLESYRAQVAAGTWDGATYRPTWMISAPLIAVAVAIQPPALLHLSWAVGVAAGAATCVGIAVVNLMKSGDEVAVAGPRPTMPMSARRP
ncbi:MAG: hypothetical protein QOE84_688 [Actinomycetota bacterium]|jgi:hypothetical protein|nr:hypothetical protein [Actinomycetota bacterium]